jgi:hypothetical protein
MAGHNSERSLVHNSGFPVASSKKKVLNAENTCISPGNVIILCLTSEIVPDRILQPAAAFFFAGCLNPSILRGPHA